MEITKVDDKFLITLPSTPVEKTNQELKDMKQNIEAEIVAIEARIVSAQAEIVTLQAQLTSINRVLQQNLAEPIE